MELISGFAGATMTDDGFIKAQMGWAVAEKQEKVNNKDSKIKQNSSA